LNHLHFANSLLKQGFARQFMNLFQDQQAECQLLIDFGGKIDAKIIDAQKTGQMTNIPVGDLVIHSAAHRPPLPASRSSDSNESLNASSSIGKFEVTSLATTPR